MPLVPRNYAFDVKLVREGYNAKAFSMFILDSVPHEADKRTTLRLRIEFRYTRASELSYSISAWLSNCETIR
jgi:hypothetical protein